MRRIIRTFVGASIWSLAAVLAAWHFTVPWAGFAAVCGSLAGIYMGKKLAASRLRLPLFWGLGLLLAALALGFSFLLKQSVMAAASLGPSGAYTISEVCSWFFFSLVIVGVLQASTRRAPSWIVLEIAAVGTILTGIFAAHKDGFINRPYFLVDPLWARGYDPVPFFIAIGVGVAILLVILTASRSSHRRTFLDLGLLCALIFALFVFLPLGRIKDLNSIFSSGTSQEQEGKAKKGESKGQGEKGQPKPQSGKGSAGGQPGGSEGTGSGQSNPSAGTRESGSSSGDQEVLASFADQQSSRGNAPVAVVLLHDDYDPPAGYFYFRQTAFSQYNGSKLVQDTSGKADLDLAADFPTGRLALPRWPAEKALVRTVRTTVALLAQHPRPFALINPEVIDSLVNPDPTRFYRAFGVTSEVMAKRLGEFAGLSMGAKAWDQELWKHYTGHPADPRYAELAGALIQSLRPEFSRDPFAQAAAIKVWLEQNGTYSLASNHEEAADPLADFLFGDRVGHCIYFAHSACLLFRTRGIPARVGAGYAVNSRNRGGGAALLVREKDSHAWPEIYLEGAGWVVMDIAPEKTLSPPEEAPDRDLQQMLGEMARQGAGNPRQESNPAGNGDLQQALRRALQMAGIAASLAAGLLILFLYGSKLWRRWLPWFCSEAQLPRLAYRTCLDRMADAGIVRTFGQTRQAFARCQGSRAFELLTAIHLEAALGTHARMARRATCLELAGEVKHDIRMQVSQLRRFLGLLNPISWLRVK